MLIELNEVGFCYAGQAKQSLQQISCRIEAGEFVVLAGANGSGKSSLLRLLNGLIPHFYEGDLTGRVRVAGHDPTRRPVYKFLGEVALLSQNPAAQFFSPTVRRELAFGLESLGLPYSEINSRLAEVTEFFGLQDLLERRPDSLSGGEQQRVLLAALIALRPKILALDEPFAALDYHEQQRLNFELERLNQAGMTILIAEQRLAPLLKPDRRCLLLEQGRLVADVPAQKLFASATYTPAAELLTPLMALFQQSARPERPLTLAQATEVCRREKLALQSPNLPGSATAPLAPPLVKLETVTLKTPDNSAEILTNFGLNFEAGQRYALLGRNGAGKTTLFRHLSGFHPPASGTSFFASKPIYTRSRRFFGLAKTKSNLELGQVGLLFQNSNLQLFLPTVREELELAGRLLGRSKKFWPDELVERLNLTSLLERNPLTLSGGEKKRVALACALASEPDLLLLDEPGASLDYRYQSLVNDLLLNLATKRGATLAIISHDLDTAAILATRWLILAERRLTHQLVLGQDDVALKIPMLETHGLQPPAAAYLAANLGQSYLGGLSQLVATR